MNSLDYIDSVFKIALDHYQNKDEVPVEVTLTINELNGDIDYPEII